MKFQISSSQETEVVDITEEIGSRIDGGSGVCTVFIPHTTAGLTENEDRLLKDIEEFLKEIVLDKEYRHDNIDNNASSHFRNLLLDSSVTVPVENGKLQLGKWQSILLIELDGPRTRTLKVEKTG